MTRHNMTTIRRAATKHVRMATLPVFALVAASVACKDTNVPFLTAPTAVDASPQGVQNAVSGLFSASRIDVSTFVTTVGAGYGRDGSVFVNTEARTVEYPLGVFPTPTSSGSMWVQEYQNINQAQQILATLPKVIPTYSAADLAAAQGVVQTMQAFNYMMIAEAHDTLGLAILPVGLTSQQAAPAVCMIDGWKYIIALLDSANTNLATAGADPIPFVLPTGFKGVGTVAGPSTTVGSFASFNRALAAKANLELAYAIPRGTHSGAPTPTSAGSPDVPSLNTAAADLTASAMYNPAQLTAEPSSFIPSAYTVTHDFSATPSDIVNPVNGQLSLIAQLKDFVADVDTAHDARWHAKFGTNPHNVQENFYNSVASTFIPTMYPATNSPIPIVREASLVLWNAQIQMGLGNNAAALTSIDAVRTTAGGALLTAYPAGDASTYTTLRNDLMREQRITTSWEASVDRTIAIRMYGMALVSDTTWAHEDPNVTAGDAHTTVNPIPFSELTGRAGGVFTTSCSM
jgi:hypothetical protein